MSTLVHQNMEYGSCSTRSVLPVFATYVFGAIMLTGLLIISIVSAVENKAILTLENLKQSPRKCIKSLWSVTWSKKRCYFPAITHILDSVTDIGVICEFGLLSFKESNWNTSTRDYCGGVNTFYLFILSIISLFLYRIISSIIIYRATKSLFRLLLQILDFELFRSLMINYKLNNHQPCKPQRLIQSLEAMFESTPQAIIQSYFLIKISYYTNNGYISGNNRFLVSFSLLFSLFNVVCRAVAEDKTLIRKTVQLSKSAGREIVDELADMTVSSCSCSKCSRAFKYGIIYKHKDIYYVDHGQDVRCGCSFYKCMRCQCISFLWLFRFVFRFLDISSRMSILLLGWILLGGFAVCILIFVEFGILFFSTQHYKSFGWVNNIIILPINTEKNGKRLTEFYVLYRIISNLIIILLCYAFGFVHVDFIDKCVMNACDPYYIRHGLLTNNNYNSPLFVLLVYVTVLYFLFILPRILYLVATYLVDTKVYANQGLDINSVIKMHDWQGLHELIAFGFYVDANTIEKLTFEELVDMVTQVCDNSPLLKLEPVLKQLDEMIDDVTHYGDLDMGTMLFIIDLIVTKYAKSRVNSKKKSGYKFEGFANGELMRRRLLHALTMPKVSHFAYLAANNNNLKRYYEIDLSKSTTGTANAVSMLHSLCSNINSTFDDNDEKPITANHLEDILSEVENLEIDEVDKETRLERAGILLRLIHKMDKNYLKLENYLVTWSFLYPSGRHILMSAEGRILSSSERDLNNVFDIIYDCRDKIFDIANDFDPKKREYIRHTNGSRRGYVLKDPKTDNGPIVRNIIFGLLPIKHNNVIKRSMQVDNHAMYLICRLIPYLNSSFLIIYHRLISCFDINQENMGDDEISINIIACLCCFCDLACVVKIPMYLLETVLKRGPDNHRNVFHYIAMMTAFWKSELDLDNYNYVINKLDNLNEIENYIISNILTQESVIEHISTQTELQDFYSATYYFKAVQTHFTSIQDDYGFKPIQYKKERLRKTQKNSKLSKL